MSRLLSIVTVLTLVFPCMTISQQQWVSKFNAGGKSMDESASLVARAGITYVTGSTFSDGNGWDIVLLALNDKGDTVWVRRYAGPADEKAVSVLAAPDGSIYVAGSGMEEKHWHAVLLKFTSDGTLLWSKMYNPTSHGHLRTVGAVLLDNGNIAMAFAARYGDGSQHTATAAFDPSGTMQWTEQDSFAQGSSVEALFASGGRLAVVGSTSNGTDSDAFVLLYDQNGMIIKSTVYDSGNNRNEHFNSVAIDQQGNILAAGREELDATRSEILAVRFLPDGTFDWRYPASAGSPDGNNRAIAITADRSGKALLTGRNYAAASGFDIVTVSLDPDGSENWRKIHAGPGTGTDTFAPLFAGISGITSAGDSAAALHWLPARDDVSMRDEITYDVYSSDKSGGQNFQQPLRSVSGDHSVTLTGLVPEATIYIVVRARDAAGNSDSNTRELQYTPLSRLAVSRDTTLPGGVYWFASLFVDSMATLTFTGDAEIHISDTVFIAGGGTIRLDGHALRIFHYSIFIMNGSIDNRCTSTCEGGDLLFFSENGFIDARQPVVSGGVFSSGNIRITNDSTRIEEWELALRPYARSKTSMAPAGSIYAAPVSAGLSPGDTLEVEFTLSGIDPDGGAVEFSVDFGDGTTRSGIELQRLESAWITKGYGQSGTYPVSMAVIDNEGDTALVHMQVFIPSASNPDVTTSAFAISVSEIAVPVGDSLIFASETNRTWTLSDTIHWNFGDGGSSIDPFPSHLYTKQGRYHVTASLKDDSGRIVSADLYVYAFVPDTTAGFAKSVVSSSNAMTPQVFVNLPAILGDPGSSLQIEALRRNRAWNFRLPPGIAIGFNPWLGPAVPGNWGQAGGRIRIICLAVDLLNPNRDGIVDLAGGGLTAGNGQDGGRERPGRNKGYLGGTGGNVEIIARLINVSAITVLTSGSGGNGGDAGTAAAPITRPAPQRVYATGGVGGPPGGFRLERSINIIPPGTLTLTYGNGGTGGAAFARGGDGDDKVCQPGEPGGPAEAVGGEGGSLVRRIGGTLSRWAGVIINGGNGGAGGASEATGGEGGNSVCPDAIGGNGGQAVAEGGKGGDVKTTGLQSVPGSFVAGIGGVGTATGGKGGDALADLRGAPAGGGCPGAGGAPARARGGNGGGDAANPTTAESGRSGYTAGAGTPAPDPAGPAINEGNGGDASAHGQNAGSGIGPGDPQNCNCDGGKGGDATAIAGRVSIVNIPAAPPTPVHTPGTDGNVTAQGGQGGDGGDCCTPPGVKGGNGGPGGNVTIDRGPTTPACTIIPGGGGNGGDGIIFGLPGGKGRTTIIPAGAACQVVVPPGGGPGKLCPMKFWIPMMQIPADSSGIILTGKHIIGVYKRPDIIPENRIGIIEIEIDNYGQKIAGGIQVAPGSELRIQSDTFKPDSGIGGLPDSVKYLPWRVGISVENVVSAGTECFIASGIQNAGVCDSAKTKNIGGPGTTENLQITAPGNPGSTCDRFERIILKAICDCILKNLLEVEWRYVQ